MNEIFIPNLQDLSKLLKEKKGNTIPVYCEIPADLLTPVSAYLKASHKQDYSFLLESVAGGEKLGRYSFIGTQPYKVTKSGKDHPIKGDPLIPLENDFRGIKYVPIKGVPKFTGGAIGYVSFDCVSHFEPRTARPLEDHLQLPESMMLYCDKLIIFDHLHQLVKVVAHYKAGTDGNDDVHDDVISRKYAQVCQSILEVIERLNQPEIPLPPQGEIKLTNEAVSNKGKEGYEAMVLGLKRHILEGDIIQAVPSQRLSRPTDVHPFNLYRRLRSLNPSPYMFFMDLKEFQLVGASPETLVKVEDRVVETHPIAGTRPRGKTPEEDEALKNDLLGDEKEIAEHVMLVDLGRNDVNRVCIPETVVVESLMHVERYSHVMHIVSRVKGVLRPEKTPFDAFRSIFPAGTVSGAPKIRAIELIREQEGEARGVYAGAVGYFSYSGDQDTCIAIRTMVIKDHVAYLQSGGGIVHDSDPATEFQETVNKLKANVTAIASAEDFYHKLHAARLDGSSSSSSSQNLTSSSPASLKKKSSSSSSSSAPESSPEPRRSKRSKSGN